MKNVIWFANINTIGGVESVIWNVIRKYDRDITIWYDSGSPEQLYRFSHYCKLKKFDPKEIVECDRLFINYGYEMIESHFKAKDVYYVIHADYEYQKLKPVTKDFHYLAVSDCAGDAYERLCGIKPELFPNPITIDDERKAILLVSATRIREDKGPIETRMEILGNALDKAKIPFTWLVFTNGEYEFKNRSILKCNPRLDIIPFLRKADFVVQLSDSEACCMTALESLSVSTPMICTKIKSFYEQGVNDGNALFLDFDMSNVEEVVKHIYDTKKFTFTPKPDRWGEYLIESKRGELTPMKKYLVKANENVKLSGGIYIEEAGGVPEVGDEFELVELRFNALSTCNNGIGKPLVDFISVVEEPKDETKEVKEHKRKKAK